MFNLVRNLFDGFRSKPTFSSDMKKMYDIAKKGTTATKIVYGVGVTLVSIAAVKAVAKTTQTALEFVDVKGETRREAEPQEIMIERVDPNHNTLPNIENVQEFESTELNFGDENIEDKA